VSVGRKRDVLTEVTVKGRTRERQYQIIQISSLIRSEKIEGGEEPPSPDMKEVGKKRGALNYPHCFCDLVGR